MTRRRRTLTDEELALWDYVTQSVAVLKRRRRRVEKKLEPVEETAAEPKAEAPPPPDSMPKKVKVAPQKKVVVPEPPPIPPLQALDRHERRKVVRGVQAIDGRIDLHGMRQAEAHGALRGFLAHSQMRGDKLVLVITGKGKADAVFHFEEERGVLRRMVPQWLRMPDLRPFVVGFEEAHQGHGGEGALYVRLRRSRGDPRP